VYVCDIHKGLGVASTHQNNPVLPIWFQAPKYKANLTKFEEADGNHIDEGQPFEYAMAASVQAIITDLPILHRHGHKWIGPNGTNPYVASLSSSRERGLGS